MQYQTKYPYATTSQQYGAMSHPREEQRRRQQEYSQALAQQVAQREQQKRREREMDQQFGRPTANLVDSSHQVFNQTRQADAVELVEHGLLDGLGRNNPQNTRTSFARGHPQPHHRLPGGPEAFEYAQANSFRTSYAGQVLQPNSVLYQAPPVDNLGFQSEYGAPATMSQPHYPIAQQNWQQRNDPVVGSVGPSHYAGPNVQSGWTAQNPMQQVRSSQLWAGQNPVESAVPFTGDYGSPQRLGHQSGHSNIYNAGRRQRTDLHDGGREDSEDAERLRRKLQQQQEMQLALERQIEEKRQQKLEAKRRQEEEDRRETERFEDEQRRQRAEQERLQQEKRRKAELEQQKTDQAAAAVAVANLQAKHQQQQKLQAQLQRVQPVKQQQRMEPPQQSGYYPNESSPNRSKNPFANSRAHLFEDLPAPPQSPPLPPNNHYGYSNQNPSPIRVQAFQQAVGHSLDPMELRRQYDDMKEELRRQQQLVDQLRHTQAQLQHQQRQRSPRRRESGNLPTLLDLEKLRHELRGELAYREQLHRQELDSLKRGHQQEQAPLHSPQQYPREKSSIELPVRAVGNTIDHSEITNMPAVCAGPTESHQTMQRSINHLVEEPLGESLVSLQGESKFVFFDGQVDKPMKVVKEKVVQDAKDSDEEQDDNALDEQSESIEVVSPQLRRSVQRSPHRSPSNQLNVKKAIGSKTSSISRGDGTDSEDEAHDFVMTGLATSPSQKQQNHRYSQLPPALASSSPTRDSGKWRLESMGANDSDDDLDASLDGEQLEILFQRNVRRHEILLCFQSNKVQGQAQNSEEQEARGAKMAWTELHQQLERNRRASSLSQRRQLSTSSTVSNQEQTITSDNEAALVSSSKWMIPSSSLFLPTQITRRMNTRIK